MLLNILQRTGQLPTTKNGPATNVNSVKSEKPYNAKALKSERPGFATH